MAAKRLTKFGIRFYGPHSVELFKEVYTPNDNFDLTVIGTGESKAVAAHRALAHLEGMGVGPITDAIYEELEFVLGPGSSVVEADNRTCFIYCVVNISAGWDER